MNASDLAETFARNFLSLQTKPSHIILNSRILKKTAKVLVELNYRPCKTFFDKVGDFVYRMKTQTTYGGLVFATVWADPKSYDYRVYCDRC